MDGAVAHFIQRTYTLSCLFAGLLWRTPFLSGNFILLHSDIMKNKIKILMLEDSTEDTEIIQRLLSREMTSLQFELATSREEFLLALDRFTPSIVLADNSLFHFNARQALDIIQQRALGIPFIMVTGTISEEFAAEII